MRSRLLLAFVAASGWVGLAHAQSALPPGNYAINGTVTSLSGSSCPLAPKSLATGVLYYPGVGRDTTQLLLQSATLQKSVTVAYMNAFTAVPASGLNGWSTASPASPNYNQYTNGAVTGGGTAALLSFDLTVSVGSKPYELAFALGTISIKVDSIALCQETVQVVLQKVASFKQSPYP